MGLLFDPDTERRRVCHALIFTACCQPLQLRVADLLADASPTSSRASRRPGTSSAGSSHVVIPDNMSPSSTRRTRPSPGSTRPSSSTPRPGASSIDATRVRRPQDKPRVERTVPYVRRSFFAGEHFIDLADAQRRAETGARRPPGCGSTARRRAGRPSTSPPRGAGSGSRHRRSL